MMVDFDTYLRGLLEHERTKTQKELDTRAELTLHAGRGLNWLGDYFGAPIAVRKGDEPETWTMTSPSRRSLLP